jgi:hypothetical protein
VYKDIPKFLGYRAGSDGSIWSCWKAHGAGYGKTGGKQVLSDRWKKLKGEPREEDGRLRYTLKQDDGTYRRTYGAIFVLEAFVGPCPEGLECCHGDGNCLNDAAYNLRWDTSTANKNDMLKHGTRLKGEQINTAKLTVEDVLEIRRIGKPLKQHANKYGVSETLISLVLKRKIWTHV